MAPPSADREDSAPLAAGEASDSEYEYEEIIEEVEEEEVVYEEVEVEEEEEDEDEEDEEEEQEEVEEEVEEEFEEEVEEEEELEETDAGEDDVKEAKQNGGGGARDDLSQNLREEENDGHLISCSSTPGTCQSSFLSNAHVEQDSSQPRTSPSNLPSQRLDEKLTTNNEDPKPSISLEHQLSPKICENRVPIEDKTDGELQLRAENPYFSDAVIQKSSISLEYQLSPKNCENRVPIEDKKDGELQLRAENPYFSDTVIQKDSSYLHNGDAINAETSNSFHLSGNKRTISKTLDGHHGAEDTDARSAKEVEENDMECSEESEQLDSRLVDSGETSRNLTPTVELPERNKRAAIICDFFAKGWCIRGSSCRFVHAKGPADSSDQSSRGIATSHSEKKDDNGQREDKLRLRTVMDTASVGGKFEFSSSLSSERIFPYSGSPVDFHMSKCKDGFISRYGHAGRDSFSWSHHDDHRIHASSSDGVNSSVGGLNLFPRYDQMPSSMKELKDGGRSQFCNSPLQLPMRRLLNSSSHPSPFKTSTTVSPNASHLGPNKRMKFTPYNWELSAPFRPSFSLASLGITIPGIQYDPFQDSIEKPSAGDATIRLASLVKTSEEQISGDMGGNHIPGSENDGHSGTSQSRANEQVVDKDSHSYGKDRCTVVAETAENSVVDCQNENGLLEESSSRPMDLGKNRSDQVSLKKASRDDRARSKIENKSMRDSEGDMEHEPKSLKYFRFSLIELVKVLLRPIWHEGRLSKDEHNMIVKKAVDKVVSTVLLDQIPATKEATKQYLSLSQPKIAKLVEGYVEKYGKSCESRVKASPSPAVFEDSNVF